MEQIKYSLYAAMLMFFFAISCICKERCRTSFSLLSACYPEEIRLERSPKFDFGGCHFETVPGSQAVFMWHHSVQLEIGGKQTKLQLTWHPSTRSAKCFFSFFFLKPIIHFTNFTAIFFGVGARVSTFLNCSQMSGVNSGLLHSLKLQGECSSAEFPASFTSLARAYKWARKRDLASEYCSKWWQRCRILGFFEDEFRKENLEFTDWNFGEWLNLAWGFY